MAGELDSPVYSQRGAGRGEVFACGETVALTSGETVALTSGETVALTSGGACFDVC